MICSQISRQLETTGDWLFKRRSYLPLLLLPFAVVAMMAAGTSHPDSGLLELLPELACFVLSLLGVTLRALAVGYAHAGTSGRNTAGQIADALNTTGMYSVCRHPLYLGNIVIVAGVLTFTRSPFFILAGLLAYFLLYLSIAAAEEKYLTGKFGETYADWAARTPFMIPDWSLWKAPERKFSFKAAFRSEIYSVLGTVSAITFLDFVEHSLRDHSHRPHILWQLLWAVSFVIWVAGRYLRKHTKVLEPVLQTR